MRLAEKTFVTLLPEDVGRTSCPELVSDDVKDSISLNELLLSDETFEKAMTNDR